MRALLITMLVIQGIATIAQLRHLARAKYPRITTWSSGEDACGVVINGTFTIWCAWLLWA